TTRIRPKRLMPTTLATLVPAQFAWLPLSSCKSRVSHARPASLARSRHRARILLANRASSSVNLARHLTVRPVGPWTTPPNPRSPRRLIPNPHPPPPPAPAAPHTPPRSRAPQALLLGALVHTTLSHRAPRTPRAACSPTPRRTLHRRDCLSCPDRQHPRHCQHPR